MMTMIIGKQMRPKYPNSEIAVRTKIKEREKSTDKK